MPGDRPIVGGAPSDAGAVVALRLRAACGAPVAMHCSAVRVSPRALITAAHCIEDTPLGLLEIVGDADVTSGNAVAIAAAWTAPAPIDLAVIASTIPLAGDVAALGVLPADPTGEPVTIIGYGDDGTGAVGVRRAGTATITTVTPATVELAPGPAVTCGGDSGGAILLGGELIAITSYGDPLCMTSSTATRIDVNRPFLDEAILAATGLPENQPAPGEADCGEPTGCCSAGASPDLGVFFAVVLVLFAVACAKAKPGPCGDGRQHGDPPPKGTAQWCTDKAGAKDGAYTEWWPSGQKKVETAYRKGRQHGAFASWYEDGKPQEAGALTDGLRTGRWKEHNEDGTLKREMDYGAGGDAYRWTTYREENGARWIEGGFKGQREHGHFIEWYPDGKKLAEGDFADGKKTGTWTYWNEDGSVSATELGSFAPGAFEQEAGGGGGAQP